MLVALGVHRDGLANAKHRAMADIVLRHLACEVRTRDLDALMDTLSDQPTYYRRGGMLCSEEPAVSVGRDAALRAYSDLMRTGFPAFEIDIDRFIVDDDGVYFAGPMAMVWNGAQLEDQGMRGVNPSATYLETTHTAHLLPFRDGRMDGEHVFYGPSRLFLIAGPAPDSAEKCIAFEGAPVLRGDAPLAVPLEPQPPRTIDALGERARSMSFAQRSLVRAAMVHLRHELVDRDMTGLMATYSADAVVSVRGGLCASDRERVVSGRAALGRMYSSLWETPPALELRPEYVLVSSDSVYIDGQASIAWSGAQLRSFGIAGDADAYVESCWMSMVMQFDAEFVASKDVSIGPGSLRVARSGPLGGVKR